MPWCRGVSGGADLFRDVRAHKEHTQPRAAGRGGGDPAGSHRVGWAAPVSRRVDPPAVEPLGVPRVRAGGLGGGSERVGAVVCGMGDLPRGCVADPSARAAGGALR